MARPAVFAVLLCVTVSFLQGCDRAGPPAPFELHTHAGAAVRSEPVPLSHPDRIVVAGGDTLYGVARRYGVPMRAIIDANALTPPFRLTAGASLALPHVRTHLVRPGDTLVGVARRYGVDASTLARTNHLTPPFIVRADTTLILPTPVEAASPAAPPPRQQIAREPPAAAPAITAMSLPAPHASAPPSPSPPPRLEPGPPTSALTPAVTPPAATSPTEATAPLRLPPVPPGKGFIWPVRGRVIAAYGTAPQGTHNDGINIAAPEGTPVLAADAGEVAYAGNELRGYGNLILLKHPNGFITAYAHNETLLVKRGDRVARGQPIAKVGATGAVSEPQLHFEVRRGSRVLDPADYLPAQTATAH
jgi:murein DD-endopeptidase MepM/ murein hydrolase activator NlpD